jgi:hypothetical protein
MAKIDHPNDLFTLYAEVMLKFPKEVKEIGKIYLFNIINITLDSAEGDELGYSLHWTVDCSSLTIENETTENADFGIEISYLDFMAMLGQDTNFAMKLWYEGRLRTAGNTDYAIGIVKLNELINRL